jgi:hypothetical protein
MFFLPRRRPIELDAERVRALRPSLNTPVVATADLPVGPACAAILVHVEPGQGLQISVGVRSLATGAVALYGFDGPLGASVVGSALDAALSFAEGMGFLFDEDVLDDDTASREKAVLRWQELIGDGTELAPADLPAAEPDDLFDATGGDLTDPPVPPEGSVPPETLFETDDSGGGRTPAVEFSEPAPERRVPLTKFRGAAAAEAREAPDAAPPAPKKRALGRLRLVKRRAESRAPDAERSFWLRLLGSF